MVWSHAFRPTANLGASDAELQALAPGAQNSANLIACHSKIQHESRRLYRICYCGWARPIQSCHQCGLSSFSAPVFALIYASGLEPLLQERKKNNRGLPASRVWKVSWFSFCRFLNWSFGNFDVANSDFYDAPMRLILARFLRPETSFPSMEALIAAIRADVENARTLLDEEELKLLGKEPFLFENEGPKL